MLRIIKGSVADSLYIQFSEETISHSVELHPDLVIDVTAAYKVVGIDIQNVTEFVQEQLEGTPTAPKAELSLAMQAAD